MGTPEIEVAVIAAFNEKERAAQHCANLAMTNVSGMHPLDRVKLDIQTREASDAYVLAVARYETMLNVYRRPPPHRMGLSEWSLT